MPQLAAHRDGDLISLLGSDNAYMDSMEEQQKAHRLALGQRIADLRETRLLSQPQLAFNAGIAQPSLWAIEKGRTVEITARTLIALCRALDTTWEYLWDGADVPEEQARIEAELVACYRSLPDAGRIALLQSARGLRQAMGGRVPVADNSQKDDRNQSAHQLQEKAGPKLGPALKQTLVVKGNRQDARSKSKGVSKPGTRRGSQGATATGGKRGSKRT